MEKGKKAKVDEDDVSEQLETELVLAVEKLQEVQDELEKVNEEASDKVLEVEQKYNEIRRPIYKKRNDIIQKSIPDFWLTAFLSHPTLTNVFNEEDQKVLKYLSSLDVDDFKDVKSGYTIAFGFRPNPYFEDTKLVKIFRFSDEGTTSVSGTTIRWKDGMNIMNNGKIEKEGNKRRFSDESFFKWFSDSQESAESVQDEIADIIKEDLWPNPLKYFNNDEDSDEYEDEDGEFDDEDEDDEGRGGSGFDNEDDDEADEDEDE